MHSSYSANTYRMTAYLGMHTDKWLHVATNVGHFSKFRAQWGLQGNKFHEVQGTDVFAGTMLSVLKLFLFLILQILMLLLHQIVDNTWKLRMPNEEILGLSM